MEDTNDIIGRAQFYSFINHFKGNPKVTFTTDRYDKKDALVEFGDKKYACEIKNRSPKYEKCDKFIMEKVKYDELNSLCEKNETDDGMMANFFGDTVYLFNIKTIGKLIDEGEVVLQHRVLPNSNHEYKYDVDKLCYLLPKKYAYVYTKDKNNQWIRLK